MAASVSVVPETEEALYRSQEIVILVANSICACSHPKLKLRAQPTKGVKPPESLVYQALLGKPDA